MSATGPFTGAISINVTGNGVGHFNANSTGDWFTTTFAGTRTVANALPGSVFSGTEWFGQEDDNHNSVQHATFAFQAAKQRIEYEAPTGDPSMATGCLDGSALCKDRGSDPAPDLGCGFRRERLGLARAHGREVALPGRSRRNRAVGGAS